MDRIFLDANVLFCAAYRPDAALARLWKLEGVEPMSSCYAIEEARVNLDEPEQLEGLDRLVADLKIVRDSLAGPLPAGIRLPEKDQPIFLSALLAKATHLLTRDALHFGPYFGKKVEGLRIEKPGKYLRAREGS